MASDKLAYKYGSRREKHVLGFLTVKGLARSAELPRLVEMFNFCT